MLRIVKIVGDSMAPAIEANTYALVRPTWLKRLEVGDIIVVNHPSLGLIVKRLVCLDYISGHQISGDSSDSLSKEALGRVPTHDISGVLMFHT